MHPDPAFAQRDAAALRARVLDIGVVHLFVGTPVGPMVAHLPLVAHGEDFRFHIARANRVTRYLDGATVLASAIGANGYISPDWYANTIDQVPTWNYVAVELDAICHAVDDDGALHAQIEALSNWHEARLDPKPRWSMAKVDPQARDRMMRAVRCFELRVAASRGTTKLSQNKSADDRAGVIAALGASDLAQAIARG